MSLYAVPPGLDAAAGFAEGFWARFGAGAAADPLALARVTVFANTPRALRRLEEALADAAPGTQLLPRLRVLTDLGADPLNLPDLPPSVPPMRRHLRLIRLVERYLSANEAPAPPLAAAPALATALEALLDELDEAGIAPEAFDGLAAEAHAAHWERLLAFVDIVRRAWPQIRAEAEGGAPDPRTRQRLAVAAQLAAWQAAAPGPVIAAGSTAAVASTAALLAGIARLPQGAVVLPGLDTALPPEIWAEIAAGRAPEHPQAPFARLLGLLEAAPTDAQPWAGPQALPQPRARLLREVFRPAPVTDAWCAAVPRLAPEVTAATSGLTLLEAAHPREEAGALAAAIREALAVPGKRAALITPDAQLARRVTAELARWGVLPDDSLGRPLASAPPAVFLRLIAEVAAAPADPVRLAGLLQHPLMQPGLERPAHLALTRRYERAVLRARGAAGAGPGRLPPWPGSADAAAEAWRSGIEAALAPLGAALAEGAPLARLLSAHIAAGEALSRPAPEASSALWDGAAGKALRALTDEIAAAADAHGAEPVAAYPVLFAALAGEAQIRPDPAAPHPRVSILGPREARTQPADLVILAGLADGVWPAPPPPDPWLSRPLRAALGLAPPEARLGLAAHDAYHALHRPEVLLSWPARRGAGPALPSRWLVRLTSLLAAVEAGGALAEMRARGGRLIALAGLLHRPEAPAPPAARPRPAPPASARPRRFSVTDVEALVADPYAVYAKRVLGLTPLDPLGKPPDALDRGQVLHRIFERFVDETGTAWPDEPAAQLLATAERVLAETVPWPDLRRIWRARIARVAPWFAAEEARRRAAWVPLGLEVPGRLALETASGEVEITARADRIDQAAAGALPRPAAVYDYKSGRPPSASQIRKGRNQQLHIQAAILAAGGFDGIPAGPAAEGAYIGLAGSDTAVGALSEEVEAHMGRVAELLGAFLGKVPFVARARPDLAHSEGAYDHLSRRAEWDRSA